MDLDVIDLFLLHEQESTLTLDGHREAFAYFHEQKEKGLIRAIGISTHAVEPVQALTQARQGHADALWRDLDIGLYREADVIHPLLNWRGLGLIDGTAEEMVLATRAAADAGLGLYGMKMLGGGHFLHEFDTALAFALAQDQMAAYAVGMQSEAEIDMNIALFSGLAVDPGDLAATRSRSRRWLYPTGVPGVALASTIAPQRRCPCLKLMAKSRLIQTAVFCADTVPTPVAISSQGGLNWPGWSPRLRTAGHKKG
jgi:hypothetical protein